MIKQISLKNFKAFKSLDDLEVKPITILCGTNSCGKSSILSSILLLKQTLENQNPNQLILLNGRLVRLGLFENMVFRKQENSPVSFSFSFFISIEELEEVLTEKSLYWIVKNYIYPFGVQNIVNRKSTINRPKKKNINRALERPSRQNKESPSKYNIEGVRVNYTSKIKCLNNETYNKTVKSPIKPIIVEFIGIETQGIINGQPILSTSIEVIKSPTHNDLYDIKWSFNNDLHSQEVDENDSISSGDFSVTQLRFSNLVPIFYDRLIHKNNKTKVHPGDVFRFLRRMKILLQGIFPSCSYIGPLREQPSRRYIYEDEVYEIGVKGENAAYLYLSELSKEIGEHYFHNSNTDSFESKFTTLEEAVQKWFTLMGICGFESELKNEIVYLNLNANPQNDTRVSIADVGFGVSQIFPIVLEGLRMPQGGTLLLEQPEIHLHPNLQMQMADYFVAMAKSGKNFIVETHSDHIVNRLIRRIVESKDGELNDLIGIYFIKPTEEGSICEEINIDDKYGITNWPDEFFDQVANEQEKIMMAGLQKRKSLRKN